MSERFPNPQPNNNDEKGLTRRQLLKGAGALVASFALDKALPKTVEAGQQRIDDADIHSPTRGNAEFIRQNDIKIHQETIRVYSGSGCLDTELQKKRDSLKKLFLILLTF